MIQCSRLAYISVVDEDEERCERNDLGQAVAGQSYLDANLQQTTYTVQGPHTGDRPNTVQRPHTQWKDHTLGTDLTRCTDHTHSECQQLLLLTYYNNTMQRAKIALPAIFSRI